MSQKKTEEAMLLPGKKERKKEARQALEIKRNKKNRKKKGNGTAQ